MSPTGIDHLLYACADLERGIDEIEAMLGVRPVRGGHHPEYGTHNALISLGQETYLEIIARDPDLPEPSRGAFVKIPPGEGSQLVTWVWRVDDIGKTAAAANDAGIGIGRIESGSRTRPDGSEISWQLTDPYAMPADGAVPFLIHWGRTEHPSGVAPGGGRLVELAIEHPEPDRVRHGLSVLEADVPVYERDRFRLSAKIESRNGLITLR